MHPKALIARVSPENRVVAPRATWDLYENVRRELEERHVFVTFTGRQLELMLPSYRHRRAAELLGILIRLLADITDSPIVGAGATTLRRQDLCKGLERDNAFYLRNARRIVGKEDLDLGVDPPPDLAT